MHGYITHGDLLNPGCQDSEALKILGQRPMGRLVAPLLGGFGDVHYHLVDSQSLVPTLVRSSGKCPTFIPIHLASSSRNVGVQAYTDLTTLNCTLGCAGLIACPHDLEVRCIQPLFLYHPGL